MQRMFPPVPSKVDAMCKALEATLKSCPHKESKELMHHGMEMLKRLDVKDKQWPQKIDQIMVGTMVCVMIIEDCEKKDNNAYPHLKFSSYGTDVYGNGGQYSLNSVHPVDKIDALTDDLSWCESIVILPKQMSLPKSNHLKKNTIYLTNNVNSNTPEYNYAIFINKFDIEIHMKIKSSRLLEILKSFNLNFEKNFQVNKQQMPEFIQSMIKLCGPVDGPLHAYIPIIGKRILEDKTLPFNTAFAAWYFPQIYAAFVGDYFEKFKNGIREAADKLSAICSLR